MSLTAWITNIIVAIVLYGGFAICVRIAMRKSREEKARREK